MAHATTAAPAKTATETLQSRTSSKSHTSTSHASKTPRASTSPSSKTPRATTSKTSKAIRTTTTTTRLVCNSTTFLQTSPASSFAAQVSQSLARSSSSNLGKGAIIGFSVGISVAFVMIISGIVSILHHRRNDHQDRSVGAHIPIVADTVLSPLSPAVKYNMEGRHEVLVEPPEIEGCTPVYEMYSPAESEIGGMSRSRFGGSGGRS